MTHTHPEAIEYAEHAQELEAVANGDVGAVLPQHLVDDTKKQELARLVAQLLQHPDKPRVQNLIASQIYLLGAKHMLAHMSVQP